MELEELMNKLPAHLSLERTINGLWFFPSKIEYTREDDFYLQKTDETFTQFIERIVKEQENE